MVEVKAGDDSFARSLQRFHGCLEGTTAVQVVYGLRQPKSTKGRKMAMLAAHDFPNRYTLPSA